MYDEVQPQAARTARGAAGHGQPAPAAEPTRRARACCECSGRCRTSWPRSPACDAVSLQPAAGAQGELTALLVAAAYFRDKRREAHARPDPRQRPRHQPASAAIAGFDAVTVKSNARGLVDLDDLQGQARRPHRRVHDHQPEHARPVRRPDRRDHASCCTSTGPSSTSTAPT